MYGNAIGITNGIWHLVKMMRTGGNMVQDHSFYVVNEGQGNGSICFYDNDGIWHNNIYQENNPGEKLGVTSTTAVFYNGKVYIVSKDNPCLVEADAATFKKTSSITKAVIDDNQAYNFASDQQHYRSL